MKTGCLMKRKSGLNYGPKKTGFILSILIYPLALFLVFYVYINFNSFIMAFQKFDIYGNKTFLRRREFQIFPSEAFCG